MEKDIYLKSCALSAQDILDRIETRSCRLNLVILDACRSKPSRMARSTRSAPSGFSKMDAEIHAPAGSVLAFACKPGMTAHDGAGRNGTFTSHLLKHLTTAVDVDHMLRAVGKGVFDETSNAQGAPGTHGSRHLCVPCMILRPERCRCAPALYCVALSTPVAAAHRPVPQP